LLTALEKIYVSLICLLAGEPIKYVPPQVLSFFDNRRYQ